MKDQKKLQFCIDFFFRIRCIFWFIRKSTAYKWWMREHHNYCMCILNIRLRFTADEYAVNWILIWTQRKHRLRMNKYLMYHTKIELISSSFGSGNTCMCVCKTIESELKISVITFYDIFKRYRTVRFIIESAKYDERCCMMPGEQGFQNQFHKINDM